MIDQLREKMQVVEDERFTREYLEADKRSIANAIQIFFNDGSCTEEVCVEYPIGHRRRRQEGIPVLESKLRSSLLTCFPEQKANHMMKLCTDQQALEKLPVNEFMDMFVMG